jgi:hypothetical protein
VQRTNGLTREQHAEYDANGFVILRGFAGVQTCTDLLDDFVTVR